jgi:4-carboxymuconolactone decarboxylase
MPELPHVTRIPWLRSDELSDEQLALHTRIVATRRAGVADAEGRLIGPYNFMLLQPDLGAALERLGASLRFEGTIPDVAREVVILLVARAERSNFIWNAHARVASNLGVTDEQLQSLDASGDTSALDDGSVRLAALANALIATGDVTDSVYSAAREVVGDQGVLEVIVLVNHYQLNAMGLRIFGAPGGSDQPPP